MFIVSETPSAEQMSTIAYNHLADSPRTTISQKILFQNLRTLLSSAPPKVYQEELRQKSRARPKFVRSGIRPKPIHNYCFTEVQNPRLRISSSKLVTGVNKSCFGAQAGKSHYAQFQNRCPDMSRSMNHADDAVAPKVEIGVDIDIPTEDGADGQEATRSTETGSSFMGYFLFVQDKC